MLYTITYPSQLGDIVLLSDKDYLLGLWFKNQKHFGANYDLNNSVVYQSQPIKLALKWLKLYFSGKNPNTNIVPINLCVTNFQYRVLNELQKVPYGSTITYHQLSDQLQNNVKIKINKSRAVGNAVGHNPILLIIPCHRVIGSDGALTGYAAGLNRKKSLLRMEHSI